MSTYEFCSRKEGLFQVSREGLNQLFLAVCYDVQDEVDLIAYLDRQYWDNRTGIDWGQVEAGDTYSKTLTIENGYIEGFLHFCLLTTRLPLHKEKKKGGKN